jgi:hypothetical protein
MSGRYVVELFATRDPALCAVCRGPATGLGHMDRGDAGIIWTCSNTICLSAIKKVANMTKRKIEAYELEAGRTAMEQAGPYLDGIGKTDIAMLSTVEYDEFLRIFITSYQDAIREKFRDTVPF